MDREKSKIAGAILGATLCAAISAQAQGVTPSGQEKADLEWRTLAIPSQPDDHCSVYWEYIGGDSTNLNNHLVIEMLGPSSFLGQIYSGFGPNKIVVDTLCRVAC